MKKTIVTVLFCVTCAGLLALAGCMVGPKYNRPITVADSAKRFFNVSGYIEDINDSKLGNWWRRFGDDVTTELVEQALESNHDLKAAAARVLRAQAVFEENKGKLLPEFSYNFSRSRSKSSFNFGGGRFSNLSTTFSQDISVSYVLDLFGKLKHGQRAAWSDMLSAQANEKALINSTIATVIKARIDVATIQKRLAIAKANTDIRQKTLDIVERRYRQGLVGPVDVRLARENLAVSKAFEPIVELSLATTQHSLDVLLGQQPGLTEDMIETLPELPDLEPVPVGIPARLLDRRPDLIAAEMSLKAQNDRIGVRVAELYPDLTLTGRFGRSADRFSDIFKDETEVYSAIIRLAAPIFKGGQIRARIKESEARYIELAEDYANTVLTAMREVEDALVTEQILQRRLEFVEARLSEAQAAEKLAQQRYARGIESILTVLESQQRRRIAEEELALLKGRIWTTRVNLFLALGGDWEGPEDRGRKAEDRRRRTDPSTPLRFAQDVVAHSSSEW